VELVKTFIDLFMHLDKHLDGIIQNYGVWTYLLLFLIIFCETGLVVTPFLPGDSLLFAAGTFAALGSLKVEWLFVLLSGAAIVGDTVNYWIGHYVGPKVFYKEDVRFLNKKYLDRTHDFYEKHGGKTIIIARFIPIILTYGRFISYNVFGGLAWIAIFLFGGYYFGNLPFVKRNFTLVILAIIFISVLPGVIEFLNQRYRSSRE
jgi:membrane-associated protein